MSWREFVADLVGSLAWPTLIVVALILLRKNLGAWVAMLMARQPSEFQLGPAGVRLLWDTKIQEVKEEAAPLEGHGGEPKAATAEVATEREELLALAEISPSAAVQEGFSRVERQLRATVFRSRPDNEHTRLSGYRLARYAADKGLISEGEAALYLDLSSLRNVVAHERVDIDFDRARDYVELVSWLLANREEGGSSSAAPPSEEVTRDLL